MAQTLDTEIDLLNAALTATGNAPITSLDDGSAEAAIAATNYERIVGAELAYPWTWTQTTRRLDRISGETDTMWLYAWQIPPDFEVDRLEVAGRPIGWESMSDVVLTQEGESVIAIGRWRPPVSKWPPAFKDAVIIRLEALYLRAINEAPDQADARDKAADRAFRMARTKDSGRRSPRSPATSALLAARRG